MTNCGACENCCASLEVTGGTYFRTYDLAADGGVTFAADGGPADEADPATVSAYRLDQYLVTVGRFRQFVAAWSGGAGYLPPAGSGRQTQLNGGLGLENSGSLGTYEMGWVASADSNIAPTDANLACVSPYSTWTNTAGVQENLPIVCASWWEAYAFCIWDEGFLPSEAEWEYAAAGGSQQREYPWGRADPGPGTEYAIYGSAGCAPGIVPVGTATRGAGRWGQLDMAGEVQEWTLDWYAAYAACTDCAYLTPAAAQVIRGGFSASTSSDLLPARRYLNSPTDRGGNIGFRCARTP
jgi:formylglycine-generating enzyme required for sulfatase activity